MYTCSTTNLRLLMARHGSQPNAETNAIDYGVGAGKDLIHKRRGHKRGWIVKAPDQDTNRARLVKRQKT